MKYSPTLRFGSLIILATIALVLPSTLQAEHWEKPAPIGNTVGLELRIKALLENLQTKVGNDNLKIWQTSSEDLRAIVHRIAELAKDLNDETKFGDLIQKNIKAENANLAKTILGVYALTGKDSAELISLSVQGTPPTELQLAATFELQRRVKKEENLIKFLKENINLSDNNSLKLIEEIRKRVKGEDAKGLARSLKQVIGSLAPDKRKKLDGALKAQLSQTGIAAGEFTVYQALALGTQDWLKGESAIKTIDPSSGIGADFIKKFQQASLEEQGDWKSDRDQFWNLVDSLVEVTEDGGKFTVKPRAGVDKDEAERILTQLKSQYGTEELKRFSESLAQSEDPRNHALSQQINLALTGAQEPSSHGGSHGERNAEDEPRPNTGNDVEGKAFTLMKGRCIECHGPDGGMDFEIDANGKPTSNDPDMIKQIVTRTLIDADMPDDGTTLSEEDKKIIADWAEAKHGLKVVDGKIQAKGGTPEKTSSQIAHDILDTACFRCHGAESNGRVRASGGFTFDTTDGKLSDTQSKEKTLKYLSRLLGLSPKGFMPPGKETGLPEDQKEAIKTFAKELGYIIDEKNKTITHNSDVPPDREPAPVHTAAETAAFTHLKAKCFRCHQSGTTQGSGADYLVVDENGQPTKFRPGGEGDWITDPKLISKRILELAVHGKDTDGSEYEMPPVGLVQDQGFKDALKAYAKEKGWEIRDDKVLAVGEDTPKPPPSAKVAAHEVLNTSCFRCHGAERGGKPSATGGFQFDLTDGNLADAQSKEKMIKALSRVFGISPRGFMPPGKKTGLPEDEKEVIRAWAKELGYIIDEKNQIVQHSSDVPPERQPATVPEGAEGPPLLNERVLNDLKNNCVSCHGPSGANKGKFALLETGRPVNATPQNIARLLSVTTLGKTLDGRELHMPKGKAKLSKEVLDELKQWAGNEGVKIVGDQVQYPGMPVEGENGPMGIGDVFLITKEYHVWRKSRPGSNQADAAASIARLESLAKSVNTVFAGKGYSIEEQLQKLVEFAPGADAKKLLKRDILEAAGFLESELSVGRVNNRAAKLKIIKDLMATQAFKDL